MRHPLIHRPAARACALLAAMLIAAASLAPSAAHAQRPPPIARAQATVPQPSTPAGWTIQPAQWLAVGAGAVVGVVAMEALLASRLVFLASAVAGGALADTWFQGRQVEIRTVP